MKVALRKISLEVLLHEGISGEFAVGLSLAKILSRKREKQSLTVRTRGGGD